VTSSVTGSLGVFGAVMKRSPTTRGPVRYDRPSSRGSPYRPVVVRGPTSQVEEFVHWGSGRRSRLALATGALVVLALSHGAASSASGPSSQAPVVTIAPATAFYNNESITVSIPANSLFSSVAGVALHVAECSDPGGVESKLPTVNYDCDGDTSTRVVTKPDGSFVLGFTMYETPVPGLEPADSVPVCNAKHYCVLMVGVNLNKFSQHHIFSAPFLVAADAKAARSTTAATSTLAPATSTSVRSKLAARKLGKESSSDASLYAGIAAALVLVLAIGVWFTRVRTRT